MSVKNANISNSSEKTATDAPVKKKKAKVKVFNKKKRVQSETEIIKELQAKYDAIDPSQIKTFSDFPLSWKTQKGLREAGYKTPTEIQLEAIGLALQGKDILGAAQTGSGKTLAFLIPILEVLFCKQWSHLDGVGALIITPTRELAYQIFETLRKVGLHHDFSAGLIIGGKDLKFERRRMDQCNIIVCTPGRLLQHMDENPLFNCDNMQILVLDEADRCLDLGFEQTMNAIIANFPPERQTLLFSATQTKSVRDLARLSLKDPSYVSVHEKSEYSTPKELQQTYVVCNLEDKISILWSFIRNHRTKKIIVFFSTCHQVSYMYDIFCKLKPGLSVLALYGTLHQLRRMAIYESFCKKTSAVLFATDLASRGLDFPKVDWVVHVDCPEDPDAYIHRSGRTARYHRCGESLLMLLPSEIGMIDELMEKKIPITKIDINPNKLQNPVRKIEAYLAMNMELREKAKRAFMSYGKSVFLMKNKKIFNIEALNLEAFSKSLGLANQPRIRFIARMQAKTNKNQEQPQQQQQKQPDNFDLNNDKNDDNDDNFLEVKRINHDIEMPTTNEFEMNDDNNKTGKKKKPLTKAAQAKKMLKKKIMPNKKIIFDDDGNVVTNATREKQSQLAREYENEDKGGIDLQRAMEVLKEEDKFDKRLFMAKVKAKHKEKKMKLKEKNKRKQNKDEEEEEEEVDEFGGSESGDEDEPDLSWLPDPDKIYGDSNEGGNDVIDATATATATEELLPVKKKRKLEKPKELQQQKKKKLKMEKLSVDQAEELALMLLNNK